MKTKKAKKTRRVPRHLYRNAVPARPLPRAVVVRPRTRAATEPESPRQEHANTPGWSAIKAVGGALATTVAGAYIARQDWVPPALATGLITGAGALLALEGPEKWKPLGLGAMSAAGGQLGILLIDDQLIKAGEAKEKKDRAEQPAPKPALPAPAKRQASDIPADALARAYERARMRMALTTDAPN
ncbi:MAG TPA: hypothetical protein VFT22_36370 [Kofleriaceae bacterium]|nr:hypothetical protein [Kofleriaceae bacterium]